MCHGGPLVFTHTPPGNLWHLPRAWTHISGLHSISMQGSHGGRLRGWWLQCPHPCMCGAQGLGDPLSAELMALTAHLPPRKWASVGHPPDTQGPGAVVTSSQSASCVRSQVESGGITGVHPPQGSWGLPTSGVKPASLETMHWRLNSLKGVRAGLRVGGTD